MESGQAIPIPGDSGLGAQELPQHGGKCMDTLTLVLSVIGCVNWGLVGLFRFDLVAWLFGGASSLISRIIYTLVGLSGLWCISFLFRDRVFENRQ